MIDQQKPQRLSPKLWLKKFGLVGFLFFLVKGLVWLALTYVIFK